jgi:transposase
VTGAHFRAHVEETLRPALRLGDTIVLNNLPAYSPDFNLIDLAFAKIKAFLRAEAARTVTGLWSAIQRALKRLMPDERRTHLTTAGYDAYGPS